MQEGRQQLRQLFEFMDYEDSGRVVAPRVTGLIKAHGAQLHGHCCTCFFISWKTIIVCGFHCRDVHVAMVAAPQDKADWGRSVYSQKQLRTAYFGNAACGEPRAIITLLQTHACAFKPVLVGPSTGPPHSNPFSGFSDFLRGGYPGFEQSFTAF